MTPDEIDLISAIDGHAFAACRFVAWALARRAPVPSIASVEYRDLAWEVRARFCVSRPTAYRWLRALRELHA